MSSNPYNSPTAGSPPATPGRIQYIQAYRSFFDSPRWGMNMLAGAVAYVVPIVGPMVYVGWLGEIMKTKLENPAAPAPDFDTNKLGYYLDRGLWPILVLIVVGMLAIMVIMPCYLVFYFGPFFFFGGRAIGDALGVIVGYVGVLLASLVLFGGIFIMQCYLAPMTLRASLEQDFGKSLQWAFIKRFINTVCKELILSMLFLTVSGMVVTFAGMCVCFVGVWPATALISFAHYNLLLQLYLLYLQRGGEPLMIKEPPSFGASPSVPPAPPWPPAPPTP